MNVARQPLLAYLWLLAGARPNGHYFDIRSIDRSGRMGVEQHFVPALQAHVAAAVITDRAPERDVYVGVALRTTDRHGGKRAIDGSHLVFIDCDTPGARATLRDFPHPPTVEIASGAEGHVHAYWRLDRTETAEKVERANRRLAARLDGDRASVDVARILRPPESRNHKCDPPTPVELIAYRPSARYSIEELTAGLGDADTANTRAAVIASAARDELDAQLRAISAQRYAFALAGLRANRAGKIACPFHNDDTPSLQLYPGGTFYCFGCRRGGTIYDFAAALWQIQPRGAGFIALRERLAAQFQLQRLSSA